MKIYFFHEVISGLAGNYRVILTNNIKSGYFCHKKQNSGQLSIENKIIVKNKSSLVILD